MDRINILDCTLRDGGYINDNAFGFNNIKSIIQKLEKAKIEFIECGYLMDDKDVYSRDVTEYRRTDELFDQDLLRIDSTNNYTLMLLGERYQIENLPKCRIGKCIIRMSFHKHNLAKAIEFAKVITRKGYRLFLQPTVIMNYEESEIVEMIKSFNELDVMGVAIVDTLGQMVPKDIERVTRVFDEHLRDDILLGLHTHNNMQMAFANATSFIENTSDKREIVIDTSLYGMGRGAGNLPTELLANYLNQTYGKKYDISYLLEACDTIIEKIKEKHPWGYSLAYYLSARYGCHPSYVLFLLNKKMLESSDINQVLKMISKDKRVDYDKDYIEELYLTYSEQSVDDGFTYERAKDLMGGREILLIGPGKTINGYADEIRQYIDERECFVININNPDLFKHDAVFYSNKKRYQSLHDKSKDGIELLTSNISIEKADNRYIFDYNKSLSRKKSVSDSALLMLLNILEQLGVKKVTLAGFDGYEPNAENYYDSNISYMLDANYMENLNKTLRDNLELYQQNMRISSITPSKNIDIRKEY